MKILVATDGSPGSGAALEFASRLAGRDRGTELVVLAVDPTRDSEARDASRLHARRVLDRAARRLRLPNIRAAFRLISASTEEDVPEVIAREADRLRADLVVVGSEGRDTLSEWVVGGTALRLIYLARRPVTVVRAPRSRETRRPPLRVV